MDLQSTAWAFFEDADEVMKVKWANKLSYIGSRSALLPGQLGCSVIGNKIKTLDFESSRPESSLESIRFDILIRRTD